MVERDDTARTLRELRMAILGNDAQAIETALKTADELKLSQSVVNAGRKRLGEIKNDTMLMRDNSENVPHYPGRSFDSNTPTSIRRSSSNGQEKEGITPSPNVKGCRTKNVVMKNILKPQIENPGTLICRTNTEDAEISAPEKSSRTFTKPHTDTIAESKKIVSEHCDGNDSNQYVVESVQDESTSQREEGVTVSSGTALAYTVATLNSTHIDSNSSPQLSESASSTRSKKPSGLQSMDKIGFTESNTGPNTSNIGAVSTQTSSNDIGANVSRFRALQITLSSHFNAIRLESAKIDVTCADVCTYLRASLGASQTTMHAAYKLARETSEMCYSSSALSVDTPWTLLRSQVQQRSQQMSSAFLQWRNTHLIPLAVKVPDIESDVRALFDEAAFIELELLTLVTSVERAMAANISIFQDMKLNGRESITASHDNINANDTSENDLKNSTVSQRMLSTLRIPSLRREGSTRSRSASMSLNLTARLRRKTSSDGGVHSKNSVAQKMDTEASFHRLMHVYETRLPQIANCIRKKNEERLHLVSASMLAYVSYRRELIVRDLTAIDELSQAVSCINADVDVQRLPVLCVQEKLQRNAVCSDMHDDDDDDDDEQARLLFNQSSRPRSFALDMWGAIGFDATLQQCTAGKRSLKLLMLLLQDWSLILDARANAQQKCLKAYGTDAFRQTMAPSETSLWKALLTSLDNASRACTAASSRLRFVVEHALSPLLVQYREALTNARSASHDVSRRCADSLRTMHVCASNVDHAHKQLEHTERALTQLTESNEAGAADVEYVERCLQALYGAQRGARVARLESTKANHYHDTAERSAFNLRAHSMHNLQVMENRRARVCASAIHETGSMLLALVMADTHSNTETSLALRRLDVYGDLAAFAHSLYGQRPQAHRELPKLGPDAFEPVYSYTLQGLMFSKNVIRVLRANHSIDESYVRGLCRLRTQASIDAEPNQELRSLALAIEALHSAVTGVAKSTEECLARISITVSSMREQRHLLKAQAVHILKQFHASEKRVHNAVITRKKLSDKYERLSVNDESRTDLRHVEYDSASSMSVSRTKHAADSVVKVEPDNNSSRRFSVSARLRRTPIISRMFSRRSSSQRSLSRSRKQDPLHAQQALAAAEHELIEATRERDLGKATMITQIQQVSVSRVQSLLDCIPTLLEQRQRYISVNSSLGDAVLNCVANVNVDDDLENFIVRCATDEKPPDFVIIRHCQNMKKTIIDQRSIATSSIEDGARVSASSESQGWRTKQNSPNESVIESSDKVFGGSLQAAVLRSSGTEARIVAASLAFLTRKVSAGVDIFAQTATRDESEALRRSFERDESMRLVCQSAAEVLGKYNAELHSFEAEDVCVCIINGKCAGVLQQYIEQLSPPLLQPTALNELLLLYSTAIRSDERKLRAMAWLKAMPKAHARTLCSICAFAAFAQSKYAEGVVSTALTPMIFSEVTAATVNAFSLLIVDISGK